MKTAFFIVTIFCLLTVGCSTSQNTQPVQSEKPDLEKIPEVSRKDLTEAEPLMRAFEKCTAVQQEQIKQILVNKSLVAPERKIVPAVREGLLDQKFREHFRRVLTELDIKIE